MVLTNYQVFLMVYVARLSKTEIVRLIIHQDVESLIKIIQI